MIKFKYKAQDEEGKAQISSLFAQDEADFYNQLEKMGLYCLNFRKIGEVDSEAVSYKFKLKELAMFCREFAIMLSSGIQIVPAIQTIEKRTEKPAKKKVFTFLIESLGKGLTLPETMSLLSRSFPPMLCSMVKAGTISGSLDEVMTKMATYYDKEHRTRSKIQVASIYPVLLIVTTLAVIILLFAFVLPQFFTIFNGMELPAITKVFMSISQFMTTKWYVIVVFILAIVLVFAVASQIPAGKYLLDKLKCTFPIFGQLMMKGHTARFTSSMNILLSSGIQIIQSLKISGESLANDYLKMKVYAVAEGVEKGYSVSEQMEENAIFDSLVWTMVNTGEESGTTELMYEKLSEYYEAEADIAVQKMMSIMEPLILVVIGLVVGSVVASVLIPMYSISFAA